MKSKFYYKKKSYALNRLLYNGKYLQKGEAQSKSNVLQCGTKKEFLWPLRLAGKFQYL